ncbi:MAG: 1-deoxy-D-xylulose-5-phosphate reductoisomerase [Candidatus Aminicenantes bacterium]|nr:1-deoxy-D-xylulose-5-phosphate reductoisomerase [Candidatus Aminicenantes bacterium]
MKNVAILGSTGSIGRNTLKVIDTLRDHFRVSGLAAGRNLELFCKQVQKYRPEIVSLERQEDAQRFARLCAAEGIRVVFGPDGAEEVAGFGINDIVVSSITGISGLKPTLAAVKSGKRVALANKESMVVAGRLIQKEARKSGAGIIPVDSEHSGVFQCLAKAELCEVKRVILTASGGPFLNLTIEEMKNKSVADALQHPRWKMGKKVTIDSATLMNKGLELIEARWLFGLMPEQLGILIHPQSIVHSLVELRDGSVLAQLSRTDMRIPIQYALTYPDRQNGQLPALNLSQVGSLDFCDVEMLKFPLVALARSALEKSESYSVALNAANEVTVKAFLREEIRFYDISEIVSEIVTNHREVNVQTVEDIFEIDRVTREQTRNLLEQR